MDEGVERNFVELERRSSGREKDGGPLREARCPGS